MSYVYKLVKSDHRFRSDKIPLQIMEKIQITKNHFHYKEERSCAGLQSIRWLEVDVKSKSKEKSEEKSKKSRIIIHL